MDPPTRERRAPADVPNALPRRQRIVRGLVRALLLAVLLPMVVVAVVFAIQTKVIFPGAETQGQSSAVVRPRPGEELVTLTTASGDRVVALFGPALRADGVIDPQSATRPTILYFCGNGQCLRNADFEFQRFRRLGMNVLIPDYVGYGMSGGSAGEAGCFATAEAAYEHLRTRKDVDPARIVAAGWSLGGAAAIDLAARRRVAGLIAFCTFTSMTDMAHRNFPFLPARLLLRHKFDNAEKIARVSCPILLGHGRRDALIPFVMSDRLADRAQSPVTRVTIEDAGHNDFYEVGGERIFDAVRRFIAALPPAE